MEKQNPYYSNFRIEQEHSLTQKCRKPECNNSPFAPSHTCSSHSHCSRNDGVPGSVSISTEHCCCQHHNSFCRIPVIFDRRYDFADRELCSRQFSLRLGGLRNRMAAKLRQNLGCKVEIGYECESCEKKIKGRINFVGTDFVEIKKTEKNCNPRGCRKRYKQKGFCDRDKYTLIPFDSINWMDYEDGDNE